MDLEYILKSNLDPGVHLKTLSITRMTTELASRQESQELLRLLVERCPNVKKVIVFALSGDTWEVLAPVITKSFGNCNLLDLRLCIKKICS